MTRTPATNSTYKKLAVRFSADTFVITQSLVVRINIYGENRQLLVAAKRSSRFAPLFLMNVSGLNGADAEQTSLNMS